MEPRHLGVIAVLVKSFARIHETNLKKQGMLALTFLNKSDYDHIQEDDTFEFLDLDRISPDNFLTIRITHPDNSILDIQCEHSYNEDQIEWFKYGSALNKIASVT